MSILNDLRKSVIDGDMVLTQELMQKALSESLPPEQILSEQIYILQMQLLPPRVHKSLSISRGDRSFKIKLIVRFLEESRL